MLKTFNCGMGFCLMVSPEHSDLVIKRIEALGLRSFKIGEIEKSDQEEAEVVY